MEQVTDRELLQRLADQPLGLEGMEAYIPGAAEEVGRRCQKIWLPAGKRSANSREGRAARQAFREQQIDLEEAVEAAGGKRGGLNQ